MLAPLSDLDGTLVMSCVASTVMCIPRSYGYAVHVREGVKSIAVYFRSMKIISSRHTRELGKLVAQPDMFDVPAIQEVFVDHVHNQLSLCEQSRGTAASESNNATTGPGFSKEASAVPGNSSKHNIDCWTLAKLVFVAIGTLLTNFPKGEFKKIGQKSIRFS